MVTEYRPSKPQVSIPHLEVPLGSRYLGVVKPKRDERAIIREPLTIDFQAAVSEYLPSMKNREVGSFVSWQRLMSIDQRAIPLGHVHKTLKQLSKKRRREQVHFLDAFISAFDSVGEEDWKKLPRDASARVDEIVYDDAR